MRNLEDTAGNSTTFDVSTALFRVSRMCDEICDVYLFRRDYCIPVRSGDERQRGRKFGTRCPEADLVH